MLEFRAGAEWVLLALGPDLVFYPLVFSIGTHLDVRLPQMDAAFIATFPAVWIHRLSGEHQHERDRCGEELG